MCREGLLTGTLAIVVPCFNEEDGLQQLYEQLTPVVEDLSARYEIDLVFVDDASTDRTCERIRALWPNAALVRHDINRGPGAALRDGARAAKGEVIVFIDSDCTYRPAEIPALLERLVDGVDIVTASPYHAQGRVVGVKAYRFALSRLCSLFYQISTGTS